MQDRQDSGKPQPAPRRTEQSQEPVPTQDMAEEIPAVPPPPPPPEPSRPGPSTDPSPPAPVPMATAESGRVPIVPGPMVQDWMDRVQDWMGRVQPPPSAPFPVLGAMTQVPAPQTPPQAFFLPQPPSLSEMSRGSLAVLSAAKFPRIRDRHGEAPDLVDFLDPIQHFSLDMELADPLGCNEIIFQFLALASPPEKGRSGLERLPRNVFFTFQFYRFPLVTTERLLVTAPDDARESLAGYPRILKRLDALGSLVIGDPGYQVKFMVDPRYLKAGEQKMFLQYLFRHSINVDIWDGESLMLLGSGVLPMRQLCRRGKEGVESWVQLPIISRELLVSDFAQSLDVPVVLRAILFLKIANVGYPHLGDAKLIEPTEMSQNSAVISHRLHRVGRTTGEPYRTRGRPLSYQTPVVSIGTKLLNLDDQDISEEKKRKLKRLENIKQLERHFELNKRESGVRVSLSRELETLRSLRQENKRRALLSAVLHSITTVHTIFPSFGAVEFMEFLLENPYNDAITVTLDISDSELQVITDPREWTFYKKIYSLSTPLDPSIFTTKNREREDAETEPPQLFLKPRENLYVPFKYQTFINIHQPFSEGPSGGWEQHQEKKTVLLEAKTARVAFKRADTDQLFSILVLQVEPQPVVVHQTLRFYHPENTFFTKNLRLSTQELQGFAPHGFRGALCSDPTVICRLDSDSSSGNQDLFVKAGVGWSPSVKSFMVMLYGDSYLSQSIQTWQLHIHAAQKLDINTVQGHSNRFSLVLKGAEADRMIRCYSSSPSELSANPRDPFLLPAGSTFEVQASFCPFSSGDRTVQVTAVDVEVQQLVRTWLISASVRASNVSKAYQVTVPIGSDTLNKKILYGNSYNVQRSFHLSTNRPDLVSFKEKTLNLGARQEGTIGLRFSQSSFPQLAEALVFVNDDDGNNEDAFAIRLVYVKQMH